MKIRCLCATAIAATVAVGVLSAMPTPASAKCYRDITREATGRIQFVTRLAARNKWRAAARQRYGAKFAVWTLAADDKTEQCNKKGPGAPWRCIASARPCDGK